MQVAQAERDEKPAGFELVKYATARRALSECCSIDEVKDIRNKAEAMRAYAYQARDVEFQIWAMEIKLRAERRAGELLLEIGAQRGQVEVGPPSRYRFDKPTITELAITPGQAKAWQSLAAIPAPRFDEILKAAHREKVIPSMSSVLHQAHGFPKQRDEKTPAWDEEIDLGEHNDPLGKVLDLVRCCTARLDVLSSRVGLRTDFAQHRRKNAAYEIYQLIATAKKAISALVEEK